MKKRIASTVRFNKVESHPYIIDVGMGLLDCANWSTLNQYDLKAGVQSNEG